MLGKLIKYDFKSTVRIFLPSYLGILLFSLLCRLFFFNTSLQELADGSIFGILLFIYVLAIIMLCAIAFVIPLQRFYTNLLRDEGYLSHTLPVTIDSHICSKLITASLWTIVSIGVVLASLALGFATSDIMDQIAIGYNIVIEGLGGISLTQVIILCVLSVISSILNIYASMAIGQLFPKNKLLGSVLAYIGMSFLSGIVGTVFGAIFGDFLSGVDTLVGGLNVAILIVVIQGAACYFITRYLLGKKLNLE